MREEERWEIIYNQINGVYVPGVCDWVWDETEGVLGPQIKRAYEARNRLGERLGVDPASDPDFDALVSGFEGLSRACGKLMYYYGYQDELNECRQGCP